MLYIPYPYPLNTALPTTRLNNVIIRPAMNTPSEITIKLFFLSRWRREARSAPVHPPVPGSGIATKIRSPQIPYLSILSLFFNFLS